MAMEMEREKERERERQSVRGNNKMPPNKQTDRESESPFGNITRPMCPDLSDVVSAALESSSLVCLFVFLWLFNMLISVSLC